MKVVTLLDQIEDNNREAKKNRYITPHPGKTVKNNGIPTLVSSDGTYEPAIHPDALAQGYGAQGYVGTNVDSSGNPTGGSMSESFTEASDKNVAIEIMKNNLNYCRGHANRLFDNLKLECEWDASANLIHILVQFKDEVLSAEPTSDSLYPYPMDITIPYDADPIIVYNSESSPYKPDMSTETTDAESDFKWNNWSGENSTELLAMILRSELTDLDAQLDSFNESLMESTTSDDLELVDESGEYKWCMDASQTSLFYRGDELVYEESDIELAQQWWESIIEDPDSITESIDSYPYRVVSYVDKLVIVKNVLSNKVTKYTSLPITADDVSKFSDITGISPYYDSNNVVLLWKKRASPTTNKVVMRYFYDIAERFGYTRSSTHKGGGILTKGDLAKYAITDEELEKARGPIGEAYAVIRTEAPFGADGHIKVPNADKAAALAKRLNKHSDPSEVRYISRKLNDTNVDKYDLDKNHMRNNNKE